MTKRERILRCFEFRHPDRMPIEQAVYPGAFIKHGQDLVDLLSQYPNDFGPDVFELHEQEKRDLDPNYYYSDVDPWGVTWECRYEGILGISTRHPLDDLSNLRTYHPPKGSDPSGPEFEKRKSEVETVKATGAGITVWSGPWLGGLNLFERMQWLRGMEELMCDFARRAPELDIIADMIVDANMAEIAYGGALGVDVIGFADDWGTQDRLMISPALWREFFKPRYAKMFEACHSHGAKVSFHSDGQIMAILPDLIEIGVDILRPQFSCLDIRELASFTKGRIAVFMDLDRQYILPFGTPEQVREHVREVVEVLGLPEGGLVGRGEIMPDVPLENAKAMLDALVEFGKY
ncbi:MAG: hypothetical protein N3B12_08920 [Armatimonadetes bacterium]|nr:hypothetical protein [Armatimonadota bacterium]